MGFELFASIDLDGRGFTRTLRAKETEAAQFGKNVERSFGGLGGGLNSALAGAFGFGALTAFTHQVISNLSAVKDLAEQYNITTDEQQELTEAARRNGLDFANVGSVLDRTNESRQQAVEGNLELIETYGRFGVTLDDLQSKQLRDLDILKKITAATAGLNMTSAERAALADLIGTKNQKVITTIQSLGELGDIFKVAPDTINRIDQLDDKLRNLKRTAQGIFANFLFDERTGSGSAPDIRLLKTIMSAFRRPEAAPAPAPNLPGVFESAGAPMPGMSGVFLGSKADRERLDLKRTELELARAIAQLEFEKLTPAQQEKKLQQDINQLKKDAASLQKSGTDLDKALANSNLIMAAEKERQLNNLQKRTKDVSVDPAIPLITDSLARVGGFATAGIGAGEALTVQKESRDLLKDIRENTRGSGRAGWP